MTRVERASLVCALLLGGLITYVDMRPGWDDTGVTAVAVLAVSGLLGLIAPRRPWLWAVAVGGWIPLFGIAREGNYGTLLALGFALTGAYAGMAVRRTLAA